MEKKMADNTPRWKYRFNNYKRAFTLLREAIDTLNEKGLTQLEKEGFIQRFEYTVELAWKVMKDYLEAENVVFEQNTPRAVIRKAFSANLISDGDAWMEALDARNKMSHTYDFKKFESVIEKVRDRFFTPMEELYLFLFEKNME
jgi:nucleotidyltransferase substrate binding protein (TIGR01987 family)